MEFTSLKKNSNSLSYENVGPTLTRMLFPYAFEDCGERGLVLPTSLYKLKLDLMH